MEYNAENKYTKEGLAELDHLVSLDPTYEKTLDALTRDQRHSIALAMESEMVEYDNDVALGREPSHESMKDAALNAAEGMISSRSY